MAEISKVKQREGQEAKSANPPATAGTTAIDTETPATDTETPAVTKEDLAPRERPAQPPVPSPEEQRRKDAVIGYDRQIAAINKAMEGLQPEETDEQRRKRERREKAARIIGAVSDGIRAMSNLYFTSRYAPDMYSQEKGSQLKATDAWLDRLKAERDANRDRRLNYIFSLGNAENGRASALRELEAQREKAKLAREKAEREAEEHGWEANLQPSIRKKAEADARTASYKATTAKEEAENAPAMQRAKLRTETEKGSSYRESAKRSKAAAEKNREGFPVYGYVNGKKVVVDRMKDKEQAIAWSKHYNAYNPDDYNDVVVTEQDETDRKKTVTTRQRKAPDKGKGY